MALVFLGVKPWFDLVFASARSAHKGQAIMAQRKGALQSGPQLKLGPNRTATSSSKRERRAPEPGSKDDTLKTGSLAPQPAASRSIAEAIGTQVRDLRRKLDLTGAELADQAGLSAGMLSKIENGCGIGVDR